MHDETSMPHRPRAMSWSNRAGSHSSGADSAACSTVGTIGTSLTQRSESITPRSPKTLGLCHDPNRSARGPHSPTGRELMWKCRKDQKRMAAARYRGCPCLGGQGLQELPRAEETGDISGFSRFGTFAIGQRRQLSPILGGDFRNIECWMLKEIRPLLNCCSHPFTPIHLDKFGAYPHPECA